MIEKVADDFDGRAKVVKVDCGPQSACAASRHPRHPVAPFFKDGKPVDQLVGVVPERVLADKLDQLAEAARQRRS